jgi:hypothetical protein
VSYTTLITILGTPGSFNQATLEFMAANNKHPIVFALSNPTSQCMSLCLHYEGIELNDIKYNSLFRYIKLLSYFFV